MTKDVIMDVSKQKKPAVTPAVAPANAPVKLQESQYAFLKGTSSKDEDPQNGFDVLDRMPFWADRYVDLKESIECAPGAKYSPKVAHSTLVSQYNTMKALAKDADKFANSTSQERRTLDMLNSRVGLNSLTESLNRKTGTQVSLKESFGNGNITTQGINNPAYSVIDMVGIFFPGSVLNHMTDVVPLPQKWNQVYRLLPLYAIAGGGVQPNEIIFQNITNGTYASVYRADTFTSAFSGANNSGTFLLADQSVGLPAAIPEVATPQSVYVTVTYTSSGQPNINEVYRDNGYGLLLPVSSGFATSNLDITNSSVTYAVTASGGDGYQTQVIVSLIATSIVVGGHTYTPVSVAGGVQINFLYDYQEDNFNTTQIRAVNLNIETVQMVAYAHPLKMSVSAEMEFEVKSIANISIMDEAQQTCVGLISMERDINYINTISLVASNSPTLTFNAQSSIYYPVTALYTTFINTLMQVDNNIKSTMGRGQLDCIIIGPQTRTILVSCPFFEPAKSVSSVGFQMIGTLMDGTVSVIFNPFLNPAAATETFIAYFKGFGPGDAPVIHGDWLPFYVTPEITMYDMNSYQSVASWYVQQVNPWVSTSDLQSGSYVWAGIVENFGI